MFSLRAGIGRLRGGRPVKAAELGAKWFGSARLAASALAVCLLAGAPMGAQTAHFNGAVVTLGSGFSFPGGVAVDGNSNVFVADSGNNAVKELLAADGYTTFATLGSGFNWPAGIAVDGNGNVFIGDQNNHEVKEILAAGGYTTVNTLVSGFGDPDGLAVDGSDNVYVANLGSAIEEILAAGGYTTVNSLGSGFVLADGVAVDASGDVFVADYGNNAVKEIVAVGGSIPPSPTINSLGSGFEHPFGVAVDGQGNVFVADTWHDAVKEIVAVDGSIPSSPTIDSLGSGFSNPVSVAVDGKRNVFVANSGNSAVQQIQTTGGNFGSVNLGATSASPIAVSFMFDTAGTLGPTTVTTQGATGLDFTDAGGDTCAAGTAYSVGEFCTVNVNFSPKAPGPRYGAVALTGANGGVVATGFLQGTGVGPQIAYGPGTATAIDPTVNGLGLNSPSAVAVDGTGDLFIVDFNNNRVVKVPAGGGTPTSIDPTVNSIGLSIPSRAAVDGASDLFIVDEGNNRVVEIPAGGGAAIAIDPTVNGKTLARPVGVALDGVGDLFIADTQNSRVVEVPAGGGTAIAVDPTVNGEALNQPTDIAVDGAGDLFVADLGNNRVVEIPAGGGASFVIDPSVNGISLSYSQGMALDGAGDLYIADWGNSRVVVVPAGGGAATAIDPTVNDTSLNGPFDLALDNSGDLFIADSGNNRVVNLQRSTPPAVNFPTATNVGSTDTTDGTQTVQIQNIGNEALALTALSYPANFSMASGDSHACTSSTSLTAGQECDLPIQFTPKHGGALSEDVTLTDNALNATGAKQSVEVTGTGIGSSVVASITSPTPGSTLTGPSVTFTWTNTGATLYYLSIGSTGVGSTNVYNSGWRTVSTWTATLLPTNGETLYVRLSTDYSGTVVYNDYAYTATTQAAVTFPTAGSTLTGPSVTFDWSAATGANLYYLSIGSTGVGSNNLFNSGWRDVTSWTATGLPTNGETVYVRITTDYNGLVAHSDTTYSAATAAVLTTPTPETTLSGSSVTFDWTTGTTGATLYYLSIGSTGVGSSNIYNSGWRNETSQAVTGLPTNSETLYVRLSTDFGGMVVHTDYTYKAQ